ncbi:MAG: hypothetical protein RLZZ383_2226, partial [Pseudomonadota bacterium]
RDLTPAEVDAAVAHYTLGQRGPRATPVDAVLLSGVGALAETLPVASWRAQGIRRVVVHATDGHAPAWADEIVRFASHPDDLAHHDAHTWVVPLDDAGGAGVSEVLAAICADPRGRRWMLSWPLDRPIDRSALEAVVALLDRFAASLDASGARWEVRGLPPCWLGAYARHRAPARNRFYVDADHPPTTGAMVFPDRVWWRKVDACRFCAADLACDGATNASFEAEDAPPLRPLPPALHGGSEG